MIGPNLVSVTPTVTATPDYSDGDAIGGLISIAVPGLGHPWFLNWVSISSKAAISVAVDMLVFSSEPSGSTFTDNGALSIHANDADSLIDVIEFAADSWVAGGTPVVAAVRNLNIPLMPSAARLVYFALLARGTINLGSTSDLTVNFSYIGN